MRELRDLLEKKVASWLRTALKDLSYPLGSFGHRAGIVLSSPSRS